MADRAGHHDIDTSEPSAREAEMMAKYGDKFIRREDFLTELVFRDLRPWWRRLPKVRPMFAWYDLWVGVFVDRAKRRVYIFPLPCLGLVVSW